jgi:hypothetical protein
LLEPCTRHALAEATVIEEVPFQAPHLLIEQIVCLMDPPDRDVRDDLGRAFFAELLVLTVGYIRISAQPPDELGFSAPLPP